MSASVFFDSWADLARILIVGVFAYAGIVFLQRVTGKRTLSKMNAFDFIVTVALGSALATVILSKDIAITEGLLGFAVLISLQYFITWLSSRSNTVLHVVKSDPKLLFYRGDLLQDAMGRERVVEEEILQAIRSAGIASFDDVEAVVLETDGTFSVIKRSKDKFPSSLENLDLPE